MDDRDRRIADRESAHRQAATAVALANQVEFLLEEQRRLRNLKRAERDFAAGVASYCDVTHARRALGYAENDVRRRGPREVLLQVQPGRPRERPRVRELRPACGRAVPVVVPAPFAERVARARTTHHQEPTSRRKAGDLGQRAGRRRDDAPAQRCAHGAR